MLNEDSRRLDAALISIAEEDADHDNISHFVRNHTNHAAIEQRALAIACGVSVALFALLREENSDMVSLLACIAVTTSVAGIIKEILSHKSMQAVKDLQRRHPARLKHILRKIRTRIPELFSVIDAVEAKLFDQ